MMQREHSKSNKRTSNKGFTLKYITLNFILLWTTNAGVAQNWNNGHWNADNGDGTYTNPILHADYSDPDVCRVGDDFYMTASSFNCVPGLPILHSTDLVNWELISYALPELYDEAFELPQHGNGVWAPAIRYHNNEFYIYWGDPDLGIYMVKAKNPAGPWSKPHLVHKAKGWIDPCPFWDDDGKAYLVHAFAGSRAGIKSILVINPMGPDGMSIDPQGVLVFDGHENHPTIEGPKLYKRNGFYYIFAPAGGVKPGWQTILRSQNIHGPYEEKIVLHQGSTSINGPHQGGWVELESGESWFIHFQDKDAYGRIVHLQPVNWVNNWPQMGIDQNNDGIGEPVIRHPKPNVKQSTPKKFIPASDEFNQNTIGLQWQWHANPRAEWAFPGNMGFFRVNTVMQPLAMLNFWEVPNLLLQKLPAEAFTATTKFTFYPQANGDKTGLIVMGEDYARLTLEYANDQSFIRFITCTDARTGGQEMLHESVATNHNELYFRVTVNEGGICTFAFSTSGEQFNNIGPAFTARAGRWIGAKVGIFALKEESSNDSGYANYDWFRFE